MIEIRATKIFNDWLLNLKSNRAKAFIIKKIQLLSLNDFCNVKSLGQKLYELKINIEQGYRVYFYNTGKEIILLLCGGNKTTQKQDIKKARCMLKEGGDANNTF